MKSKVSIAAILLFAFLSTVPDVSLAENANYKLNLIKRFYSIGTATINGTYYPVGNSIARTLSKNLKNLVFIAEPTEGSVANVEYLRKNQIDLALMQSDIAWQAARGVGTFVDNSFKELRVLSSLYSEVVQIVVKSNSSIKTIADLKGCKMQLRFLPLLACSQATTNWFTNVLPRLQNLCAMAMLTPFTIPAQSLRMEFPDLPRKSSFDS
jgi:TRAP transporter TAXI family solute receptor